MDEYVTVRQEGTDFFIEKKSKFIGSCAPVDTEDAAHEFIDRIKKTQWDANHNVYAYILRNGVIRFSDDGEPQGKAGIPVLDAMKKSGVVDLVIVATRYFGGIMLGGGGLIRAYSHTASIAMNAAEKVRMTQCNSFTLECDYEQYGRITPVLEDGKAFVTDTRFLEKVSIDFYIEPINEQPLTKRLTDVSNGRIKMSKAGMAYYAV